MVQFFTGNSAIIAPRAPDYRTSLAQSLMQQGTSSAPVRTPMEGIGRMAQALSGAYIGRTQKREQEERDKAAQATLSKALAGFNAPNVTVADQTTPQNVNDITASFADFNPGSTGVANVVETELGPDEKIGRLASVLAGNSDLAPMAANLQLSQAMAQAEAQRKAEAAAAARAQELADKKVRVLSDDEARAMGVDPTIYKVEVDAFGNPTFNKISDVLSPDAEAQKLRLAAAGKPVTNIVNEAASEGLTEEQKKLASTRVNRFDGYVEAGNLAETQLSNIRSARSVATEATLPSQFQKSIGDVGAALGFSAEKMRPIVGDIDSAQKFVGSLQNLVLEKLQAQKGPQTENDARRIEKTVASLGNTPEARDFLLRSAEALALRDVARRDFYDDFLTENETLKGADQAWSQYMGGAPMFAENPNSGQQVFLFEFMDAVKKANPGASRDDIMGLWREKYQK